MQNVHQAGRGGEEEGERRQIWQRQRQMKLLKPHYNGARQSETDGEMEPRLAGVGVGGGGGRS